MARVTDRPSKMLPSHEWGIEVTARAWLDQTILDQRRSLLHPASRADTVSQGNASSGKDKKMETGDVAGGNQRCLGGLQARLPYR